MKFPKMKCDKCGRCCSIVFCSKAEYGLVQQYAEKHSITPLKQGVTCPYFIDNSCAVYPVRPYLCKLFGHTHELRCANGHNKNISTGKVAFLNEEHIPRQNAVCLHEAVYTDQEIAEILDGIRSQAKSASSAAIAASTNASP